MFSADELWTLLYDEYLPFSLYADHKNGASYQELSARTGLPVTWIEERISAAKICISSGSRLAPPAFDRRRNSIIYSERERRTLRIDAA